MADIKNLSPVEIWRNFDKLTQVPRPSGHLGKIQAYLLNWAKEAGVEAFQDAAGNIVMRKPATPGMENRKGVILQAHMDMVPQKAPESNHDFENDPIETIIDGDWVRANHTTLGSDDGLGVATIMAVMEAKDLQHGPVEGLITADEETGMFGANGLPEGELNGDILLNLDTEVWGEFVIGSAGGIDINGEVVYGHDGFAGELGHTTAVRNNGRTCNCGKTGCLETYASATGVTRTAREWLELTDEPSVLRSLDTITSKDVYDAAKEGDKLALRIFDFTGKRTHRPIR